MSSEIHLCRVYRAPRSLVWQAWTEPDRVAQWWGPRGFTLTHHSKDLRVGGSWVYTMHGPDGTDFPNTTRYLEVIEGQKLVYDHGSDGQSPPLFRLTVTFSDVPEGTQMDMTMAFASVEIAKASREFIRKAGGNATWDRLAEYLNFETQGVQSFVIQRAFEAPRDLLFKLWTQPQHLAQWLPTVGATMEYLEADIRTGGSAFFRMTGAGKDLFALVEYHEVLAPERLTYTQMFTDEKKEPGRHPMLPVFPDKLHITAVFAPECAESTRVCLTCRPEGVVGAEEWAAFLNTRAGMTVGWNGSFDKLEGQLEELTAASS